MRPARRLAAGISLDLPVLAGVDRGSPAVGLLDHAQAPGIDLRRVIPSAALDLRPAVGGRAGVQALDLNSDIDSADSPISSRGHGNSPRGQILDVGCGPGHWTNWLHEQGINIAGVDPTPEFIRHAQDSYPDIDFSVGRAEQLDVADSSLVGILAWYSLIHMPPDRITDAIAEFARNTKPGGGLLMGFFEGQR